MFDIMACARACRSCWACFDSGIEGNATDSPFARCTLNYARKRFLLSTNQLSQLRKFTVFDENRAHGTSHNTINLVLVQEAKKASRVRFKDDSALELERCRKETERKDRTSKKMKTAWSRLRVQDTAQESGNMSNFRGSSDPPTKLPRNSIALYQRTLQISHLRSNIVSNYGCYPRIYGLKPFQKLPEFAVSERTLQQVQADYPSVQAIFNNLYDTLDATGPGDTILVDKICDLRIEASRCVGAEGNQSTASVAQITRAMGRQKDRSLRICNPVKLMGTIRGSLLSTGTVLFVHSLCHLENLHVSMDCSGEGVSNYKPSISCVGGSQLIVRRCRISSGDGRGFCFYSDGMIHVSESVVTNRARGAVFFGGYACANIDTPGNKSQQFLNNVFELIKPLTNNGFSFKSFGTLASAFVSEQVSQNVYM